MAFFVARRYKAIRQAVRGIRSLQMSIGSYKAIMRIRPVFFQQDFSTFFRPLETRLIRLIAFYRFIFTYLCGIFRLMNSLYSFYLYRVVIVSMENR